MTITIALMGLDGVKAVLPALDAAGRIPEEVK